MGRSRGGLTTKIHAIVDALGNPLALSLTGGQVHDITQAETLAAQVQPKALLADKSLPSGLTRGAMTPAASLTALNCAPASPSSRQKPIGKSNAIAIMLSTASAI